MGILVVLIVITIITGIYLPVLIDVKHKPQIVKFASTYPKLNGSIVIFLLLLSVVITFYKEKSDAEYKKQEDLLIRHLVQLNGSEFKTSNGRKNLINTDTLNIEQRTLKPQIAALYKNVPSIKDTSTNIQETSPLSNERKITKPSNQIKNDIATTDTNNSVSQNKEMINNQIEPPIIPSQKYILISDKKGEVNSETSTGIEIKSGDSVSINATGEMYVGLFYSSIRNSTPDGYLNHLHSIYNPFQGYPHAALFVSIDGTNWYLCGSKFNYVFTYSGYIKFQINDNHQEDNSGKYHVSVKVYRKL